MSFKQTVAKTLNRVEHGIDRTRFLVMSQLGVRKPLKIHPYIGYGSQDKFFIRGRVLLENSIREAAADDSVWRNLVNMYHRFESDEIPHATVRISGGGAALDVQCDEEGFFYAILEPNVPIPQDAYWQSVQVEVIDTPINNLDTSDTMTEAPVVVPSKDAAFGVISDLDDTIVKTDVLNLFKMLRNTIFRNAHTRLPFDGVATFYQALHEGINCTNNPLFYVSSSPWNLYDLIIEFYKIRGIPLGPVFLRDIGLSAHALGAEDHMGHKLGYISRLLERHPDLPFILIGDSGQKDVWVYEEVVRRYPGRVKAIYIRDVTTNAERTAKIAPVQAAIREMGSEMLLVKDTCEAAEHAYQNGYITQVYHDEICLECGKPAAASLV